MVKLLFQLIGEKTSDLLRRDKEKVYRSVSLSIKVGADSVETVIHILRGESKMKPVYLKECLFSEENVFWRAIFPIFIVMIP